MQKLMRLPVLVVLLILLSLVMLGVGSSDVSLLDMFRGHTSPVNEIIFWQIRLPRILLAIIVGAGVSVAGAAIQGLFRNPLADPAL
ncbi:MAG: iron complex transport system permease protein, partial [Candidatus Azotimanducaceae bacterium]